MAYYIPNFAVRSDQDVNDLTATDAVTTKSLLMGRYPGTVVPVTGDSTNTVHVYYTDAGIVTGDASSLPVASGTPLVNVLNVPVSSTLPTLRASSLVFVTPLTAGAANSSYYVQIRPDLLGFRILSTVNEPSLVTFAWFVIY